MKNQAPFDDSILFDPYLLSVESFDEVLNVALLTKGSGIDPISIQGNDYITEAGLDEEESAPLNVHDIIKGEEVSPFVYFNDWREPVGFFCALPVILVNTSASNNSPSEEFLEPSNIFDFLRNEEFYGHSATFIFSMHPLRVGFDGIPLGLLSSFDYSPDQDIPDYDDGSQNGFLMRGSLLGTGTRNMDFDDSELLSGKRYSDVEETLVVWYSFMNQGFKNTGVAESDFHDFASDLMGLQVTPTDRSDHDGDGEIDTDHIISGFSKRGSFLTSGPLIDFSVVTESSALFPRDEWIDTSRSIICRITVKAARWIYIEETRIVFNGDTIKRYTDSGNYDLSLLRLRGLMFQRLIRLTKNSFISIVTGVSDLFRPLYTEGFYSIITYGHIPFAITNPIFIDVNGYGWNI